MDMRTSRVSYAKSSGKKLQRGLSLTNVTLTMIGLALIGLVAAKLVPAYADYASIKKVLNAMKSADELKKLNSEGLRQSYSKRSRIDNITSITPADLQIEKDSHGDGVISVDYSVKTPLVANISLVIDFSISTANLD
jgi:hypothetical protein